jgi:S1-C subfamily serine protease
MQTLRLVLIAVVSSASTLLLTAGCDAVRSAVGTSVPTAPAATQPPAAPPASAQAPAQPTPAAAAAKPPAAQAPAAPVTQAPSAQVAPDRVVQVYRDVRPSVVTVLSSAVPPGFRSEPEPRPRGTGSGFMVDDRGHILTNNHVVEDADRLEVTLANGLTIPAQLVGRDSRFDLAVVRAEIPGDQLKPARLADSDTVEVGESTIGNPYGLEGTVTAGIVSARRPVVVEPEGDGVLVNAIQTDAAINPGNSGGPLLNMRGEVIGVNTLGRLSQGGGQAGLNFASPINNAKKVLPDLIANGTYPHPFVGISSAEITQSIAEALNLRVQEGLLIQNVEPNTGAARAGLRGGQGQQQVRSRQIAIGGDVVTAIDGTRVKRPEDFVAYLETNRKAGDTVTLTIVRDGQERQVQVTLGERPRPQR